MMIFHYSFMFPAIAVCLVLAGIHTYFGYHIVERGVIFVDLSLSQIAALGASVAILMGWGENAPFLNFCVSLAFTMGGAVLFAFLRKSQNKAPMEALIGISYAGAIAVSLLVLEKSATGTEHIKEMLVGTILTVSWHDVLQLAAIVLAVGIIHWLARKKLFMISEDPGKAAQQRLRMWWWDVVFYATFGESCRSAPHLFFVDYSGGYRNDKPEGNNQESCVRLGIRPYRLRSRIGIFASRRFCRRSVDYCNVTRITIDMYSRRIACEETSNKSKTRQ